MRNKVISILDKIIYILSYLWFHLYSYKTSKICNRIKNRFYSKWLSLEMRNNGKNVSIQHPVFITNSQNIKIGENSIIGHHCILSSLSQSTAVNVNIGNDVNIGDYFHLTSINNIYIGNGVLIGRFCIVSDNSHGKNTIEDIDVRPDQRELYSKGRVYIDDHVWIGDKVTILSGVYIGKGAIIGANSVVIKDIPPYAVYGGVSAKELKKIR